MSSKSYKIRRVRFDGAYMFAAVFAAIGGLLLLGSYASSKPINTFEKGTYNLADYSTNDPDVFNLGLNADHFYCFSPVEDYKSTVISVENGKGTYEPVKLSVAQDDAVCFKPKSNVDKAEVKIVPVPETEVALRVVSL